MTLTDKNIDELIAKGFTRWTKGNHDRLYVAAKVLGLECEYYKTGNISSATLWGKSISNSQAYRLKAAKTYIDLKTGEIISTADELKDAVEQILKRIEEKEAVIAENMVREPAPIPQKGKIHIEVLKTLKKLLKSKDLKLTDVLEIKFDKETVPEHEGDYIIAWGVFEKIAEGADFETYKFGGKIEQIFGNKLYIKIRK